MNGTTSEVPRLTRKLHKARSQAQQERGTRFLKTCGYLLEDGSINPEYKRPAIISILRLQDAEDCTDAPEVVRASGDAVCSHCGRPYSYHPQPYKLSCPTTVVGCDGRYLKL